MVKVSAMSQEFGERTVFKRGAEKSVEEIVSRLVSLGFDGIELECGSPRLPAWNINGAKQIKEICDSNGLAITNLAPQQFFLMPGGEWQMQKELLNVRASCQMANAVDAPYVRIQLVSWTFSSLPKNVSLAHYSLEPGGTGLAAQFSHGVTMVTRSVKIAEEFGVTLGLDNHMFLPVRDHLRIVKELGSENLKLFMDVRNSIEVDEDPIETARACGNLLVHSHVKDALKGLGSSESPLGVERAAMYGGETGVFTIGVPVGMGNILDWKGYLTALKDINYKGYLSIEGSHVDPRYPPFDCAKMGLDYLKKLGKEVGI